MTRTIPGKKLFVVYFDFLYFVFTFGALSCRPSLFTLTISAQIHTLRSQQRHCRGLKVHTDQIPECVPLKSCQILISVPAAFRTLWGSLDAWKKQEDRWSGLLSYKAIPDSHPIFPWQNRYGGRLAEEASIPKHSRHFPIITQEESH